MNIKPVKRYAKPGIPKRDDVDRDPNLLRHVPKRWQGNQVVLSALTAALALGSVSQASAGKSKPSRIAPIFEHGEGRAAFGGTGQRSPTVFISELDARQIILEEARRAGLAFDLDRDTLRSIRRPVTDRYAFVIRENEGKGREAESGTETLKTPLGLDATDIRRKISFEYVSQEDFDQWETKTHKTTCTLASIDIRMAAQRLRKALIAAKPKGTYVVFYDPVVTAPVPKTEETPSSDDRKDQWKAGEIQAGKLAREEIRKQVRDFVKWLKAQGVI